MKELVIYFGADSKEAEDQMMDVLKLEINLANIALSRFVKLNTSLSIMFNDISEN